MTKSLYEAPSIVEIGTLHELTLMILTKSNPGSDAISGTVVPGQFS